MSAAETWLAGSDWAPLDADRARALAERLHRGQCDASGAPLLDHVGRVAAAVPHHARVVAWLHEVLEHTATSEEALLEEGR
jgi:(p)ppGpp synthase/HD superfamily hydrolase